MSYLGPIALPLLSLILYEKLLFVIIYSIGPSHLYLSSEEHGTSEDSWVLYQRAVWRFFAGQKSMLVLLCKQKRPNPKTGPHKSESLALTYSQIIR